jgi:hypothetical protein
LEDVAVNIAVLQQSESAKKYAETGLYCNLFYIGVKLGVSVLGNDID